MPNPLIDILCCPVTHEPLVPASSELLARANRAQAAGNLLQHDGERVAETLAEALVTRDGRTLYRIDDGIPVLLEDTAIPLAQLDG